MSCRRWWSDADRNPIRARHTATTRHAGHAVTTRHAGRRPGIHDLPSRRRKSHGCPGQAPACRRKRGRPGMTLTDLTLAAARDGLRAKQFTAEELTRAHLEAIEALNSRLNAYVTVSHARAMDQVRAADAALARGEARPLTGIPLAIKDLFCTEGVRTTAGSRILGPFVPPYESTVTANLLRDGAVFLGKANMDEFAMGSSNMTSAWGPVASPWQRRGDNRKLVPGGSSGGSAAAVAARLALGAIGTDTGG